MRVLLLVGRLGVVLGAHRGSRGSATAPAALDLAELRGVARCFAPGAETCLALAHGVVGALVDGTVIRVLRGISNSPKTGLLSFFSHLQPPFARRLMQAGDLPKYPLISALDPNWLNPIGLRFLRQYHWV